MYIDILFQIPLLFLLALTCLLYVKLRQQHEQLATTRDEINRLQAVIETTQKEETDFSTEAPAMRLSIKVHNPMELAKRESKSAKLVGHLIPDLIEQKVYEQVRDEIAVGLQDKAVDATIKIEVY